MHRLIIYCEGPTEESFINTILYPYLFHRDIFVTPITKHGIENHIIMKNQLLKICNAHSSATITTMFDLYGLPDNTPGIDDTFRTIYEKVQHVEAAIEAGLGKPRNLFFNLMLHEFEGLLFTDISAFIDVADAGAITKLQEIKDDPNFPTPEHINNTKDTAPSKRIKAIVPTYSKVRHGTSIAQSIGIEAISSQCHHFKNWIDKITNLENIR